MLKMNYMFYCTLYEDLRVPLFDVMQKQTNYSGKMMARSWNGYLIKKSFRQHVLFLELGVEGSLRFLKKIKVLS